MKRAVLVVLDGWGERAEKPWNAVRTARTPTFDELYASYPHTLLEASEVHVGLPEGQMGNSEVGHLNLGAGRIVYQDLTRINVAIADGSFHDNQALVGALEAARASGGALHLFGLTSPGGVHSSLAHAYAVVELARRRGFQRVYWHAFLDGRDVPPKSAQATLEEVDARLRESGVGRLASLVGRYYAMDRDSRWERVQQAWNMLVHGEGRRAASAVEGLAAAYAAGETDEFVKPTVLTDGAGVPLATVKSGDAVVFWNFRSDRARQLTRAMALDDFSGFPRPGRPALSRYVCMTQYDATFGLPIAFPPQSMDNLLGGVLAARGVHQFRCAETEKYAHVTFFFNGGVETPFALEERQLVPSDRSVPTYDKAPRMSAEPVTDAVVAKIESGEHGFILVNYANPDMVGHTGVMDASVIAVETVDTCLGRIIKAARAHGVAVLITADHGNCETMWDPVTGQPHTAHTMNPVPLIVADDGLRGRTLDQGGRLCDVAPTLLGIMGIPVPAEMTGRDLLVK